MILSEVLSAIIFYFTLSSFAIIGWPLAKRIFNTSLNIYHIGKIIGLLLFGYSIWLLASLHILDYQNTLLISGLWLALIIGILIYNKVWTKLSGILLKKNFKEPAVQVELVLLFVYIAYLFLRTYNPATYGTERFMDMMLFSASSKTHYFPFLDSWYAGHTVNYYYYGSYLMSLITKLAHAPLFLAYNFSLGLIFTEVISITGLIAYEFTAKKTYAILAAFLVVLSGSLFYAGCEINALLQPVEQVCSYASSTRLYTPSYIINEIPSYSFTVGDLHAHVLGLMLFVTNVFLILMLLKVKKPNLAHILILIVGLASSALTNAWDFITLCLVLGLVILNHVIKLHKGRLEEWKKEAFKWLATGAGIGISCLVLMLPFLLKYTSPVLGLGFAPTYVKFHNLSNIQYPTPLLALLGMWGILLLGCILGWWVAKEKKVDVTAAKILLTAAILIIIGVEIFFIPDIYSVSNPPYFRANTVFKFGYHAWVMLCLAFCFFIYSARSTVLEKAKAKFNSTIKYINKFLRYIIIVAVLGGIIYPLAAINQFYLSTQNPGKSLNGAEFMKTEGPGDYQAVEFVNKNVPDRAVLVEAAGDSYKYFGRISVFTGSINPVNWLSHEWTWRLDAKAAKNAVPGQTIETGWGPVAKVSGDVTEIYETPSESRALSLLNKYHAQYVYIGQLERQTYPGLNEEKFYKLGNLIYSANNIKIFKIQ